MNRKIAPCLWFDDSAEEAVGFYTSLFERARLADCMRQLPIACGGAH